MSSRFSNKISIGVIRGGNKNYSKSLEEGGKIISYLKENLPNKTSALDILVDKNEIWHLNGLPIKPMGLLHKVDLIWDTTTPAYSQELAQTHLPIYRISHFNAVLGSSKDLLREYMKTADIQMPNSLLIPVYQKDIDGDLNSFIIKKAKEVHNKFGSPWLVKSFTEDESMGIHVAKTFPELLESIHDGVVHNKSILVEELIEGRKVGIHAIHNFRDNHLYCLLPYEINLNNEGFDFKFDSKFSKAEKENLFDKAKNLFEKLGLKNYIHPQFVLHPRRGVFVTSIELMPDFSDDSTLIASCKELGIPIDSVVLHIIENSLQEK